MYPDLAARLVDHYTPAEMASLMWNHLPEMFSAIGKDQVARPQPSARDAEDMFAQLYAAHFVTPAGNQERGERAFEQRIRTPNDPRERRTKLVRDIRHEVLPKSLKASQFRGVVQNHDRSAGPPARAEGKTRGMDGEASGLGTRP